MKKLIISICYAAFLIAASAANAQDSSESKSFSIWVLENPPVSAVSISGSEFEIHQKAASPTALELKRVKGSFALIVPATPVALLTPKSGTFLFNAGRFLFTKKKKGVLICSEDGSFSSNKIKGISKGYCLYKSSAKTLIKKFKKGNVTSRYIRKISNDYAGEQGLLVSSDELAENVLLESGGLKDEGGEQQMEGTGSASCIEVEGGEGGNVGNNSSSQIDVGKKPAKLRVKVQIMRK